MLVIAACNGTGNCIKKFVTIWIAGNIYGESLSLSSRHHCIADTVSVNTTLQQCVMSSTTPACKLLSAKFYTARYAKNLDIKIV